MTVRCPSLSRRFPVIGGAGHIIYPRPNGYWLSIADKEYPGQSVLNKNFLCTEKPKVNHVAYIDKRS